MADAIYEFAQAVFDHKGPEIEPHPLDEQGLRLRSLFVMDLDKCHCTSELFDMDPSSPFLCIGEHGVERVSRRQFRAQFRAHIPLREAPITTQDLENLFIEAAKIAMDDDDPFGFRDLIQAATLVPKGSGLDGIEVDGLPCPIAVSEPEYLGQYIQNYSRCGAFIHIHGVRKL